MPKTANAPVTTRLLVPEVAEQDISMLYRQVPQLEGEPPFKVKYVWFTPEDADKLIKHSDRDQSFRQRVTTVSQVRRWKNLIATNRFVHMLPAGPICIDDEDKVLLNGKHRLTAVAGQDKKVGFVVFENVPRWMFAYFDTNKPRTISDVFHIGNRHAKPQTASAMKLALRYEEMLTGVRPAHGWRHWAAVRDEHQDVDDFLARRDEIQDWYGVGEKVQRDARLLSPSVMVFYFYQSLAWPEGADSLQKFCESLMTGGNLAPKSPALLLREWSRDVWFNKDRVTAKREVHLHLLMRSFGQHQQGSRFDRLVWAYGNPMSMPYHPKGPETAVSNVRFALEEINKSGGAR